MCCGWQRARENNHLETWHCTVPALRGHHLVRLAPDHDGVEFFVERAEVDRWIGNDPVVLALWSGDEAVKADGNVVTHASRHAFSLSDRMPSLFTGPPAAAESPAAKDRAAHESLVFRPTSSASSRHFQKQSTSVKPISRSHPSCV